VDSEIRGTEDELNLINNAVAENLAYIIYTSGSSGAPKGTLVTHANVARLFAATQSGSTFTDRDVWSLFHSYAFDFSVWELWGALLFGGRLVIVPEWIRRSPEAFHQLLCKEQVTVLNQTPAAFNQLMRADANSPAIPSSYLCGWLFSVVRRCSFRICGRGSSVTVTSFHNW